MTYPQSKFSHPWYLANSDMGPMALCVDEWVLINMSETIRSNPDWKQQYKQPAYVNQWKSHLTKQFECHLVDINEIFDYVIQELSWYEELESWQGIESNGFKLRLDDKVLSSDVVVPPDVKQELKLAASKLTADGSNKLIHLVNPSLYPLQYGITPIIVDNHVRICKYLKDIMNYKPGIAPRFQYDKFQWLPSLMCLHDDGYILKSYVNNLHPKYRALYNIIEKIFNYSLPGLEFILSRYQSEQLVRIQVPSGLDAYDDTLRAKLMSGNKHGSHEDLCSLDKLNHIKPVSLQYSKPITDKINLKHNFNQLKIMVNMFNIQLTPENPSFEGGSWHVAGTINEDIVATILYCYDSDNITQTSISLRCMFDQPYYEHGDEFYCNHFFGLKNNTPMNKQLGSLDIGENQLLMYPNIFQHRIGPCSLKDPTKNGYKKILCIYLVDPYNDMMITTNQVPPQQKQWWDDNHDSLNDILRPEIKKLVIDLIGNNYQWPLLEEQANDVKDCLIRETIWSIQDDLERYRGIIHGKDSSNSTSFDSISNNDTNSHLHTSSHSDPDPNPNLDSGSDSDPETDTDTFSDTGIDDDLVTPFDRYFCL